MKTMVEKICHECGKVFFVKPYRGSSARFCSPKCWVNSDESKKIVSITQKKRHREHPVTGSNNPNWKGGIIRESRLRLIRKAWKDLREEAISKYGTKCKYCGKECKDNIAKLVAHHIIPSRNGGKDEISNIEMVCASCHPSVERGIPQAIWAKCKMCLNGNEVDCRMEECPLYPYMPYKGKK